MSWLEIPTESHFSLNNTPFGIISVKGSLEQEGQKVGATRYGDHVVDLSLLEQEGLLATAFKGSEGEHRRVFNQPTLNDFAALPAATRSQIRLAIQELFGASTASLRDNAELRARAIHSLDSIQVHLPLKIPDFVDYSVFPAHGRGAGRAIFGEGTPLPPSWNTLPMAYNGRAGTVSVKEEIVRPQGQTRAFSAAREAEVGPSKALDWEFEIGCFVGTPTEDGTVLTPSSAASHIFGFVLLNDWSARDIQAFEMVPLGPFNGKSFATTISPWVVLPDALEPFRASKPPLLEGTPFEQADYLREDVGAKTNYSINCETSLRLASSPSIAHPVALANFASAFFSFPQLLTSQTYSGAPLRTGDLLGSGTISSDAAEGDALPANGCMLELSQGGKIPLQVGDSGEKRAWIEDGDEVVFNAWAGEESKRVGFGQLRGKVRSASELRAAE